mgnify:CR=1 FL=1
MTLVEALSEGLKVTAVGLCIVFSVLIILMLVMMLMKVVFYKDPNKAVKEEVKAEPEVTNAAVSEDIDETELIAVLTAAIAASLNTSTYNLNIKSYRRIENASPAWNKAGLRDVIDSRF